MDGFKRRLTIGDVMGVVGALAVLLALGRFAPMLSAHAAVMLGLYAVMRYVPARPFAGATLDEWLVLGVVFLWLGMVSLPPLSGRTGRCTSFPPGALLRAAKAAAPLAVPPADGSRR